MSQECEQANQSHKVYDLITNKSLAIFEASRRILDTYTVSKFLFLKIRKILKNLVTKWYH